MVAEALVKHLKNKYPDLIFYYWDRYIEVTNKNDEYRYLDFQAYTTTKFLIKLEDPKCLQQIYKILDGLCIKT